MPKPFPTSDPKDWLKQLKPDSMSALRGKVFAVDRLKNTVVSGTTKAMVDGRIRDVDTHALDITWWLTISPGRFEPRGPEKH
jgi:hypothetical protein